MKSGLGLKAQELFSTSRDLNKLHLRLVSLRLGKRVRNRLNVESSIKDLQRANRSPVPRYSRLAGSLPESPYGSPVNRGGNSVHIGPYNFPILTQKLRMLNSDLPPQSVLRRKLNIFFPVSQAETSGLPRISAVQTN